MKRITNKQLEILIEHINKQTNSPLETWGKDSNGNLKSNIGNYNLSGAYGGVKLERIVNESGAAEDVFSIGFTTKRDLYNHMHAFIRGLEQGGSNE